MRKSDINFNIELDEQNVPEKITWNATDKPTDAVADCKAITLSLWDGTGKGSMRIDLWTKEMPVGDMKRFYIETIAGMADSILGATGDKYMADEMGELCQRLINHLKEEQKAAAN